MRAATGALAALAPAVLARAWQPRAAVRVLAHRLRRHERKRRPAVEARHLVGEVEHGGCRSRRGRVPVEHLDHGRQVRGLAAQAVRDVRAAIREREPRPEGLAQVVQLAPLVVEKRAVEEELRAQEVRRFLARDFAPERVADCHLRRRGEGGKSILPSLNETVRRGRSASGQAGSRWSRARTPCESGQAGRQATSGRERGVADGGSLLGQAGRRVVGPSATAEPRRVAWGVYTLVTGGQAGRRAGGR